MKCKNLIKLLPAHLEGVLDKKQAPAVKEHLANCPGCQRETRLFSDSWDMLGILEPIQPSADFRARFWERLRREGNVFPGNRRAPLPAWAPALAGFFILWFLGVLGGIQLFKSSRFSATSSDEALVRFVSPYPQNSIEKIFLEGRTPSKKHGGNA